MSLRVRLALTYCALIAFIVATFGITLYSQLSQALEAEVQRTLRQRAASVELLVGETVDGLADGQVWRFVNLDLSPLANVDASSLYVQVMAPDGAVVVRSDNLRGTTLPVDRTSVVAALDGRETFSDIAVGNTGLRVLSQPLVVDRRVVGVLQVGQSLTAIQQTSFYLVGLLVILGALVLLVGVSLTWVITRRSLLALGQVSEQAARIADERGFHRRLSVPYTSDEVGRLASTIDHLLAAVDDTLTRHREFVADTSHELRNPLLAIRTNLELLERVTRPEDGEECVREARQQVERMSRLVADLLLLARVEAGEVLARQPVELDAIVRQVHKEFESRAPRHAIMLGRLDPVSVLGDAERLGQVLRNLLDNAIRHTPPDGKVTVGLEVRGDCARLSVADTGDGIPPEHLPRVFDRFLRAPGPAGTEQVGTGLGLAIAKRLTEAHGGSVTVESAPGQGACFEVWLPLGQPLPHLLLDRTRNPSDLAPA